MTNPPNSSNRLTADTVKTRIGVLAFEKGFPTEETNARSLTRSTTSVRCRPTCGRIRSCRSSRSGWPQPNISGLISTMC